MSCDTLNQQPINLNISFGSLPEGYCPSSFQQFGADMAARLIISNNGATSSFAIGSTEPTSNVGPWLKNCLEWFVFDDSRSKYIPEKQTFNNFQVFDANGNFTVPDNTYNIRVEAWGAGGGGGSGITNGGGTGGGSGAYGLKVFSVLPSQSIPIVVGMGGTGGAPGTSGTASVVLTMSAGGGGGGIAAVATLGDGGNPGVVTGADIPIQGQNGYCSDNRIGGNAPGAGGSAPNGGGGGQGSMATASRLTGVAPGGGGGGGSTVGIVPGGSGANGRVIVYW